MTEILLLRHAEPESAGLYIGRGSNPTLSGKGCRDAEDISGILADEKPTKIYTSPLNRAVETVAPAARKTGIDPIVIDGFSEMDFGEWEGLSWKQVEQRDPEIWHSWLDNPWKIAPPGGETLRELQERVISSLKSILKLHTGGKILIASHGGPIRTVLSYVLLLDPSAFWSIGIDYACLCRFGMPPHGALELRQWNVSIISR